MGIDIQVVATWLRGQCYYYVDPKIAETAHRVANEGVAEFCARKPDRFLGLGASRFRSRNWRSKNLNTA